MRRRGPTPDLDRHRLRHRRKRRGRPATSRPTTLDGLSSPRALRAAPTAMAIDHCNGGLDHQFPCAGGCAASADAVVHPDVGFFVAALVCLDVDIDGNEAPGYDVSPGLGKRH